MQKTKRVKNPGKQRKRLFNAPAHIRHKIMSAPLSRELAASRGAKTLPVRKGDTVRIMRGDNKGFEGKVSRVALKEYRIYMEGLTREKVDGTNIFLPIHPSKVQIRNLNLDDKWRKDILTRKKEAEKPLKEAKPKAAAPKPAKKAPAKPAEEVVEEKPQEAAPEIAKEQAPAEEIAEVEEAPKEAQAKKPRAKKPAAKAVKKSVAKEEVPEEKITEKEEKTSSKKAAKPKAAAKKTAEAKEAPAKKAAAKKTAAKPRAKRKASEEAEGGQ
jgi:large subunit ribosomal protein L24